jgi:hypothetical protein
MVRAISEKYIILKYVQCYKGLAASLVPRLENVTYFPGLYGWAVVIKERCMEVFFYNRIQK